MNELTGSQKIDIGRLHKEEMVRPELRKALGEFRKKPFALRRKEQMQKGEQKNERTESN